MHVLLIDDDPVQLRTRENVLRGAGFFVSIATSLDGALALLRAESLASSLSAIIADHLMPGGTGVELARAARELKAGVPIIVVNGVEGAEDEYKGLNVVFRQKPCPPQQLTSLLHHTLSRKAA